MRFWVLALSLVLPHSSTLSQKSPLIFSPSSHYSLEIIEAFRQAPGDEDSDEDHGNCASIAVIKAAMATFGPSNIFKSEVHDNGLYKLTLRNGENLTLSDDESDYAAAHSGFIQPLVDGKPGGDPEILRRANFIFAVLAKRVADDKDNDLGGDIKGGVGMLNGGYNVFATPDLLGLAYRKIRMGGSVSYMHANGYHAVFASDDFWDDYGKSNEENMRFMTGHNGGNIFKDLENINLILVDVAP
ncbi:hypothetical protein [Occallatibacter savannae]|uniref:hypothetical protein n=1 Tax=Occallatibacter savannae TaxID=1002691 RepID=UPI0013A53EE9|nr:hypothetical protein [Occallatibacter savannae]